MNESIPPKKKLILGPVHALASCVVLSVAAIAINKFFHSESLPSIALKGAPLLAQAGIGVIIGSSYAFLSLLVFSVGGRYVNWLGAIWTQMMELVAKFDLSGINPLWFGITAGIGEEFLFRGALQPIIGIWWTSLIFLLFHVGTGQFWNMNWKKAAYAVTTVVASVLLGYVFLYAGLLAAIVTHALIDIIVLFAIRNPRQA